MLVVTAALALAGAAAGCGQDGEASPPRPGQPAISLERPETVNFTSLVTRPGKPVTFAVEDARNESNRPVKLVSYRARTVPDALEFLGDGVLREGRPYSIDGDLGYPPQDPELGEFFEPLDGYDLAPFRRDRGDRGTQLLIGFKPLRRGFFPIRGLELTYVQDGRRRVARSTEVVAVCAVSAREYRGSTDALYEPGGICHSDLP